MAYLKILLDLKKMIKTILRMKRLFCLERWGVLPFNENCPKVHVFRKKLIKEFC